MTMLRTPRGRTGARLSPALLATLLATACVRSGSPPGHTFSLHDENGVTVALSSAVPNYAGELFS